MACLYWNNTHNQDIPYPHSRIPCSMFPIPCSHSLSPLPIPIPYSISPFPIPCSLFPIPYHHSPFHITIPHSISPFPIPCSLFPIPYHHSPFPVSFLPFLVLLDLRSEEPVMNTVNTVAMAPGGFRDGKKPPATSLGSQQVPFAL